MDSALLTYFRQAISTLARESVDKLIYSKFFIDTKVWLNNFK